MWRCPRRPRRQAQTDSGDRGPTRRSRNARFRAGNHDRGSGHRSFVGGIDLRCSLAWPFADGVDMRCVLTDEAELAHLMVRYDPGVSVRGAFDFR